MRNFEERKAEIFRRSENRINEKNKKRKRIISICIPLLICLGAYSIFILPAMMPAGNADNNEHQEIADSIVYPTAVKFIDNNDNIICTYTESEKIIQLCDTIDTIINENYTLNESESIAVSEDSYSVVFIYNTNSTAIYKVIGNTLFNTATKNYYTITAEQKEILDLFIKE